MKDTDGGRNRLFFFFLAKIHDHTNNPYFPNFTLFFRAGLVACPGGRQCDSTRVVVSPAYSMGCSQHTLSLERLQTDMMARQDTLKRRCTPRGTGVPPGVQREINHLASDASRTLDWETAATAKEDEPPSTPLTGRIHPAAVATSVASSVV